MRLRHLLVAASVFTLASQGLAQEGCEGWDTGLFFSTATIADVVACISTGADVNAQGEYGMTPLHFAAALNDNRYITVALIAAGAELEAKSEEGYYSPLHLAARYNLNPGVIEVLLNAGAKVGARDHANLFPRDYATDREALQDTAAYQRLEPGIFARSIRGTVGLYVAAVAATSKVFEYLWDILLGSYGMAREALDIFGESGGWMLAMISNPTPFLEAYSSLSRYAGNLNWSNIDPTKYLKAGMRGAQRSITAVKGVWETIPAGVRAQGQGATKAYLQNMDWSHFEPYIEDWNDGPEDGIFEDSSLNRSRGKDSMTKEEISAARRVLRRINVNSILEESTKMGARVGLASLGVAGAVAVLDYGLQYQEGKITADEMLSKIGEEVALAGAGGAAMSALVVATALMFPPLIPVMGTISIPLMVFGFAVMGERLVAAGAGWYEVYRRESPLDLDWVVEYYEYLKAKALGWVPSLTS